MLMVENLEVVYDEVISAVKGVSLELPPGQIVTVLGPNGSGKTSVLRAIAGVLKSQEGEITGGTIQFEGRRIDGEPPERISRLGIMLIPEGGGLFEDLTVQEHLQLVLVAGQRREDGQRDLQQVWEWFPGLKERLKTRAGYLSGGEQQMLALARALLIKPKVLLMDEPSLGLAPRVVMELFGFLERLNREEGVAILLVEQNAAMALAIADHGYILENGRIVLDGPAQELLHDKEVRHYYLGVGQEGKKRSYRDAKHYKTRKRWLS